ncbi:MAG: hypothetical protein M1839_005930 [Geoglossum umbratile]|nr:MAG: hypothetical protein M1839_005930 [Geoglossum umbratile]
MNNFDLDAFTNLAALLPTPNDLFLKILAGYLPSNDDKELGSIIDELAAPSADALSQPSFSCKAYGDNQFKPMFMYLNSFMCKSSEDDHNKLVRVFASELLKGLTCNGNFKVCSSNLTFWEPTTQQAYSVIVPSTIYHGLLPILTLDCTSEDYGLSPQSILGRHHSKIVIAPGGVSSSEPASVSPIGCSMTAAPLPKPVLRQGTWIQLFALALKARIAEPEKEIYESFTARFDGPSLTIYAASFPRDFIESVPAVVPPTLKLYRSQTFNLRHQEDLREAARALLGIIKYLNFVRATGS